MSRGPKFNVSTGVNFSDVMRNVAKEFYEKGKIAEQQQREADARHQYDKAEEYFVMARRRFDGAYSVETVAPVLNLGMLTARGPSKEGAIAELRMVLAKSLFMRKHCYDVREVYDHAKHWDACRMRAAKALFPIADTFGEKG